jgi:RNA polymerase sigma factor (sigma-70 family)
MNATLAPVDFTATLETLWEEYRGKMAGYMMLRIRDKNMIEDLVSAVYLRAWVAMLNGNGYTTNALGWMYQIARSVVLDYLRSLKRTVPHGIELDAAQPDGDEVAGAAIYERALASEDETEQHILRVWLDGLDISEIAELTGNTAGGIRQINHRAFRHLRESLKEIA